LRRSAGIGCRAPAESLLLLIGRSLNVEPSRAAKRRRLHPIVGAPAASFLDGFDPAPLEVREVIVHLLEPIGRVTVHSTISPMTRNGFRERYYVGRRASVSPFICALQSNPRRAPPPLLQFRHALLLAASAFRNMNVA
jgi:hypothetical protein